MIKNNILVLLISCFYITQSNSQSNNQNWNKADQEYNNCIKEYRKKLLECEQQIKENNPGWVPFGTGNRSLNLNKTSVTQEPTIIKY